MKLGVQHLQRVLLEGGKESEEKAARISRTLVEQIDTLSGIATAFGDFARMPGTALKAINLVPLIEDTIGLYGSETDTEMTFIEHSPQVDVVGDKDQLLRILGNLVKNAVQAIPADRKGHVTIAIEQQGPWTCIKISDNGVGIPESQRHKLFVPEFTTKSSGSGLGLAMVKAMAEGMGGHVAFEPIEPNGSRFIVNLRSA
jgi:signal transduction histidine kinase